MPVAPKGEQAAGVKYVRRLMGWFASRLLVLALILILCVVVFYDAMNTANIRVILKDGMAKRTQVIMGMEDVDAFRLYITDSYRESDGIHGTVAEKASSPYQLCDVVGIDHRLDMDFVWFWPWDTVKTVRITERVPKIDGRAKRSGAGVPAWQDTRYEVTLELVNKQWKISRVEALEIADP